MTATKTDLAYDVKDLALAASCLGAIGSAMLLAAFRKPERPLAETLPTAGKSWAWGGALALVMLALGRALRR